MVDLRDDDGRLSSRTLERDIQVAKIGLTPLAPTARAYAVRDSASARQASAPLTGSGLATGMVSGN